ncbi:ABC transporter permease subunit [Paraburkholderia sp. LEh10]|uniref:ABC transporter permease subunit n=1 Tax=Paraburkholderia sp. LEh10 TaxID=2821353 RepID=UPI001AE4DA8F|nr:ABC transporter permease subunit [Paraburkholderia sp. LEh10]MBP0593665.1 ABC transporter permease subunit [Paraburkholderia sp. LEh10]
MSSSISEKGVSQPTMRLSPSWLLVPAILVLGVVYGWPLVRLLRISFGQNDWTMVHYVRVLSDSYNVLVLFETFRLSFFVALICLLVGYPIAYLISRLSKRWSVIVTALVVLPLWTSTLIRSFAWMVLLGRHGVINDLYLNSGLGSTPLSILYNRFAVYVGTVHIMLPLMVFPLLSAMKKVDWRLIDAAKSMGARPAAAFLLIFVPLTKSGMIAGFLLVFILTLGFFVTPALLGGPHDVTFVMLIERAVNELSDWEAASAMCVILLLATFLLYGLYRLVAMVSARRYRNVGRSRSNLLRVATQIMGRLPIASASNWPAKARKLSNRPGAAAWITGILIVTFLVLPILIILPISFSASPYLDFPPPSLSLRWYENYFTRADWIKPTLTSLQVAIAVAVISTLIGSLAAIALVRGKFAGKAVITAFLVSPSVVPTLITAVAIYFQFAKLGLVGTLTGLTLAHTVIAVPIVLILVMASLKSVDTRPEVAAQSLGAHPIVAFTKVTLPAIRPGIISASLFAFLTSFDDIIIALFVSSDSAKTLPMRMWEGIRFDLDPTMAAASSAIIILSIVLLAIARRVAPGAGEKAG